MLTIGTDTEIFARDMNGRAISLCGKIGGSKEKPKPLTKLGPGFAVQEDNVSVEFNIPPVRHVNDWNRAIEVTLKEVASILEPMKLYFSVEASISFDKDQLIHPNALIFGCEPDYNAWTKMENQKPQCNDPSLRTAGGHIHVGTRENIINCVEAMDLFLGVPSVIIDDSPASISRRNLYGKAGAMRPKPYGFEYRVLSNFWVFTEITRRWVHQNTEIAVGHEYTFPHKVSASIQECINTGNKKLAENLIKEFEIPMPDESKGPHPSLKIPTKALDWVELQGIFSTSQTQGIQSILDDLQG